METGPRPMRSATHQPLTKGLDAITPAKPLAVSIPVCSTSAITLRTLEPGDRRAFISLVQGSLDHLAPWLPVLADGTTPEDFFDQEIVRTHAAFETGNAVRCIALRQGRIVGSFSFTNITRAMTRQCDASWWVGRPYLRQGIARTGLAAMLKWAFLDEPHGLGLHRVMATIDPDNKPSLQLARSFGFTRVPSEDHYLRIGPTWKKHQVFAADAFELEAIQLKPNRPRTNPLPSKRD